MIIGNVSVSSSTRAGSLALCVPVFVDMITTQVQLITAAAVQLQG